MKKKVIVGMSGGVDSSVAACLLLEQNYAVEGVFMKNWEALGEDGVCLSDIDLNDAESIATLLGIPLSVVNFSKDYWERVFKYFLEAYQAGRTPNPDVLCNKEIKFKAFLKYAMAKGADFIATGHYARTYQGQLFSALDGNKDQSYFLYAIDKSALKKTLFPVGKLTKAVVRDIAAKNDFHNHNKKDSTGICFIGECRFRDFLKGYLLAKPGQILSTDNEVLGRHDGLMYYTIGQRQGLQIGGLKNKAQKPWYVAAKDIENNTLIVVQGADHPSLLFDRMTCHNLHYFDAMHFPLNCTVKIRYRHTAVPCKITQDNYGLSVIFKVPQKAVTPGQAAVFYKEDRCLGGATIVS